MLVRSIRARRLILVAATGLGCWHGASLAPAHARAEGGNKAVAAKTGQGAAQTPTKTPAGPAPGAPTKSGAPVRNVRPYVDGVRINWTDREIELDAAVVLREGPLELLACSPQTREHESILVVQARPRHIYEAMGLIGLTPGAPVSYNDEEKKWLPASGERLDLRIRYGQSGKERTVPAADWLLNVDTGKPPVGIRWLFAGSRTFGKDRFGADYEGTIVAVVDFDTSLIAPAVLHTADNSALWLAANTKAIPKRGTRCVLTVRSGVERIDVMVGVDGRLTGPSGPTSAKRLADHIAAHRDPDRDLAIRLRGEPAVATERITDAVSALVRLGCPRTSIEVVSPVGNRDEANGDHELSKRRKQG